jgi:hypothetical protein
LLPLAILPSFLFAAVATPSGWHQHLDSKKNTITLQPVSGSSASNLIVKYYPIEWLEHQDISDWLQNKLTANKAPVGQWQSKPDVIRDKANVAHGFRTFQNKAGIRGRLSAVAVTMDRQYVRLAVMIQIENAANQGYLEQGRTLLWDIYKIEKADALEQERGHDIEPALPKIEGIKKGVDIKPGRYVGSLTKNQKVLSHYEVILYPNGEYEFLKGLEKSGRYTYSQYTGRLDMTGDFNNFDNFIDEDDFCLYGLQEKTGNLVILARDDRSKYQLRWVSSVDRISPEQKKKLEALKQEEANRYPYVTRPGKGVALDQIETVLYTYEDYHDAGGVETEEALYLLLKDGRVMDGIPVAPNKLDVAKSQSREPDRWGWWKHDGKQYRFAWNANRTHFVIPTGQQVKAKPIPAGTQLEGTWEASTSYVSHDFTSTLLWGVSFDNSEQFKKYHKHKIVVEGETLISNAYHDTKDEQGSDLTRNRFERDQEGSYIFNGYHATLKYGGGLDKQILSFTTGEDFKRIWFEDSLLSRRK